MSSLVTVTIDTSGLASPLTRSFGDVGLVGYGITGTDNTVKSFTSLSGVIAEFGSASAIAKSAEFIFANGVNKIYIVKATSVAGTQEVFSGDGTTKTFTVTKYLQQGSVVVQVATVTQVEGTDYTVDYGNKKITFLTAPPTGVSNVTVDFDEISATNYETALVELERKVANIVVLAMAFEAASLLKLKTHVIAATSAGLERIGVAMLPNGNADAIVDTQTMETYLASELMILMAHNSEQDVAAAVAGAIGRHEPHISMIMKNVRNIACSRSFTPTELDALLLKQINPLIDPELIAGAGNYMGEGFNLSTDVTRKYIDVVRVGHDLAFKIKSSLILTIGNVRITRSGMSLLKGYMNAILMIEFKRGVIEGYDSVIPVESLLLIEPSKRSQEEVIAISNIKNGRELLDLEALFVYSGAVHKLGVKLKFK